MGVQGQVRAQRGGAAPAHDPVGVQVHYERDVAEPGPGRHVGDVGDPALIRAGRGEVALEQVGVSIGGGGRRGGAWGAAAYGAVQPEGSHPSVDRAPRDRVALAV